MVDDAAEWERFFEAGDPVFANTSFFPALGNHEENSSAYYDAFGMPEWYSFDCAGAHVAVLDSNTWIGDRMDDAVDECWQVAQRGQLLTEARRAINDRETAWELQQAQNALGGNTPNDTQARTIRSLESQLETAARMDALIESTKDRLDLLNARLDESVTRAIELSVSGGQSGVASLDDDVEGIVDELASLRLAIEDLNSPGSAGPSGEPRTARGS